MFQNKYIKYLSDKVKDESFIDRLKIKFRPLIFPVELLLNQLEASDTLFDIGCGSGQFSLLAVQFKKIKTVYGLEIQESLVKNANNLFKQNTTDIQYKFVQYNGKALPNEIELCNKVFLNDVLHHIPPTEQIPFLKEIYTKMQPGAKFVLKDIDASSLFVYFNKIHDLVFAGEIGNEISFDNACKILEEIGFEIISTDIRNIAVYPHYTIICKK